MKIVLIACEGRTRNIHSTLQELESAGNEVLYVYSPMICSRWNIPIRIMRKLNMNINRFLERKGKKFEAFIVKYCLSQRADMIYDMGGFLLNDSAIEQLKSQYYLVLHLMDRIHAFPRLSHLTNKYDTVLTYAKADYEWMKNQGINCHLVPPRGDSSYFYHIKNMKKGVDVSFVGSMYPRKDYGYRWNLLSRIVTELPNCSFRIAGKCASIIDFVSFQQWFFNKRIKNAFINRSIDPNTCNTLYNESKIVLSMERSGFGDSWSGRLSNILMSKSMAIVKYDEKLESIFKDNLVYFHDSIDLKEKIEYYLSNETARLSMAQKEFSFLENFLAQYPTVSVYIQEDFILWKKKNETK